MRNKMFTVLVFVFAAISFLGCGSEESTVDVSSSSDFGVGDTVTYGDYDVTLQSARVSNNGAPEEKTYIYLMFDVKNNTSSQIMSNIFLMGASLSTVDGKKIEDLEYGTTPPYEEELEACWIEAGKYVTGEVAFLVDEELTDYLFEMDAITISEDSKILLTKDEIAVDNTDYSEPVTIQSGAAVTYGDYDVTLKSVRASNEGAENGKTYLYLMFDVANNTSDRIMSNSFLTKAQLSTVDGKQIEALEYGTNPPYQEELEPCWIEIGKYVTGEVAFLVDEELTDYLFTVDGNREIIIKSSDITVN